MKTYFGEDIDDPHTCDLVINTDRILPNAAARMVMDGLRQRLGNS